MAQDRALNNKWLHMRKRDHVAEWDNRNVFYDWCAKSGYREGLMLCRKEKDKPYGPDNCYWTQSLKDMWPKENWETDFCRRWARSVNGGRKQLGLPILPEN